MFYEGEEEEWDGSINLVPLHRPDLGGWVLTYKVAGRMGFAAEYSSGRERYIRFATEQEAQTYAERCNAEDAEPEETALCPTCGGRAILLARCADDDGFRLSVPCPTCQGEKHATHS